MEGASLIQLLVTAVLSSGVVGAIVAVLGKRVWSPESKNELARIGNEFAQILLDEARSEREELRATIRELEAGIISRDESIARLKVIAEEKDTTIRLLEERQFLVARKIQNHEPVTFYDIFGPRAAQQFPTGFPTPTEGDNHG